MKIEDTERFVDQIADAAYDQAVNAVQKTVIEETHNMDFELIEDFRKKVASNKKNTPQVRNIADKVLGSLMKTFSDITHKISERLTALFGDPKKKKEIKAPIKESIRSQLARVKEIADVENKERAQMHSNYKQHDIEL